jgi:hypothetical protein
MFGKGAVLAKIEAVAAAPKTLENIDCLVNELSLDTYRIVSRYFTVNVWAEKVPPLQRPGWTRM